MHAIDLGHAIKMYVFNSQALTVEFTMLQALRRGPRFTLSICISPLNK